MQTVELTTTLPTGAERVWTAMKSPATFLYLCRGLFGAPVLEGRVEEFRAGEAGTARLWAFHVIPAYRHTIEVLEVDPSTRTVRTHEHGGVLRTWNHTLHVEPLGDWSCRYTDTIDIDAGMATPIAVAVAKGIFRYRHRRWGKLVRRHLLPDGPSYAATSGSRSR